MTVVQGILLAVAVVAFGYLGVAMFKPGPALRCSRGRAQLNDLCSRNTRFSRPIALPTIRFRHGVEIAAW